MAQVSNVTSFQLPLKKRALTVRKYCIHRYGFVFLLMKQVAKLEVAVEDIKSRLSTNEPTSTGEVTMQDIEELQSEIKYLSQEIEKVKDKERKLTKPAVGVKVGLTKNIRLVNAQLLVYDKIITNTGDAYSTRSGKFIAPVSGNYIFSVTSCSESKHWDWLIIVHEGVEIGRVLSGQYSSYNSCNSAMATAYLQSGSAVWVERKDGDGAEGTQIHYNGASFTAVLVA